MALSQDTTLPILEGDFADHPQETNTVVFEGAVISVTAGGFARPAVGTDPFFAGIAAAPSNNNPGAAGDKKVKVRRNIHFRQVALSGAAQADVGTALYASDDGTFTLVVTSNLLVGKVHALVGTNTIIAKLEPTA